MRWMAVLGGLLAFPALADEERVAGFASLAESVGPLCALAPSEVCVETAFALVDQNDDDALTLEELRELRTDLELWLGAEVTPLTATEANSISLGLWIVDVIGLATLFQSYDANADGRLELMELTADVELDDRPLGQVVVDPNAVNWPAVRARLGALSQALPLPY